MNAPLSAAVAIPATQTLVGATYGFQGIYFDPTNSMSASVPAMFVIR